MGGVVVGVAYLVDTNLVLFGYGKTAAATLPEVSPFLLLGPRGLARISLLGVCCGGTGVGASAACPSAVMTTMISSSCLVSVGVRVTLAAVASNSASTCSASLSEAGGNYFFLPFLERTGTRGFSSGSFSSSSYMMCFFLTLLVNCQLQTCHPLPQVGQIGQQYLTWPLLVVLLQPPLPVRLCQ